MEQPGIHQDSPAWVFFVHTAFAVSVGLMGVGIWMLPVDLWIKGYFAMGIVMMIQSCITMTKTLRDVHEGSKLVNRIEDARAERLLMEIERAKE